MLRVHPLINIDIDIDIEKNVPIDKGNNNKGLENAPTEDNEGLQMSLNSGNILDSKY
jgi:hypothetical protein